ncbi:MAG: type II toxin-antitoxin system HigB family toxin [Planctomycetota bacterium]
MKPSTLRAWGRAHPNTAPTLRHWLNVARQASWTSLVAMRRDFPHADPVRVASGNTVYVFNIGSYRLVAAVKFRSFTIYLLRFMTHAEYDKGIASDVDGKPGKWRNHL